MILNDTPENKAVVSNVGALNEFRIRNSAKAFNILSNKLYANIVRAIIRELSCNAVDSHVEAGKANVPYDVHLPNSLEPWFSIRDYGIGLSHDQVINIYTTYFESTKTKSNDLIGALGLGSKSPFGYTSNFTVIAIRDKVRGVYTALINEQGLPTIALMDQSNTDEPNGVEVKFSVNASDFHKFKNEAKIVYKYFKLRPVIHGAMDFSFADPEYIEKDIIPGVHNVGKSDRSVAVMGNIEYPIEFNQIEKFLNRDLKNLLECGLEMHFQIGELDFQPSREGLNYNESTVQSIKQKLESLNGELVKHIAKNADPIKNIHEKAKYLDGKYRTSLFKSATVKYCQDTKFVLLNSTDPYNLLKSIQLFSDESAKHNISIRIFHVDKYRERCVEKRMYSTTQERNGVYQPTLFHLLYPNNNNYFIVNDTNRGAFERAKYHFRNTETNNDIMVYVLDPIDKHKKMNVDAFMKDIYNPPNVVNASELLKKPINLNGKKSFEQISVLKYGRKNKNRAFGWTSVGTIKNIDTSDNKKCYYVELKGWEVKNCPYIDFSSFMSDLGVFLGHDITEMVYGIRKADMAVVTDKANSNWVNLFDFVREKLSQKNNVDVLGLVNRTLDIKTNLKYYSDSINVDSPYSKLYKEFEKVGYVDPQLEYTIERLSAKYGLIFKKIDISKLVDTYTNKLNDIKKRYPMLKYLSTYGHIDKKVVADYINMIDKMKGE